MIDKQKLYTSKLYMEKLANGINPLDDSELPQDSLLNDVALCRCFVFCADILGQVIDNHGAVKRTPESMKDPFSITEDQRSEIWISDKPVGVTILASRINEKIDENVKGIAGTHIAAWMEKEGLLVTNVVGAQKVREPSEEGIALGLSVENGRSKAGMPYKKVLYNAGAQAFVIANLEAIAEFAQK